VSTGRGSRRGEVRALERRVEELTRQVQLLERLARTDPLTGLANRRGWDEQVTRELARARRSGEPMSVAHLDHFKRFNDERGHQAGDALLVEAAARWSHQLREIDTLCRWGGDEFAVVLPDCGLAEAADVIARLETATPRAQTFAAGVATWDGGETAYELLRRADRELLDAKQRRGGGPETRSVKAKL
jgi:diguanylate cyclase (GGDEF)-like protein